MRFYRSQKLINDPTELFGVALFSYLSPEIDFSLILLIFVVIFSENNVFPTFFLEFDLIWLLRPNPKGQKTRKWIL